MPVQRLEMIRLTTRHAAFVQPTKAHASAKPQRISSLAPMEIPTGSGSGTGRENRLVLGHFRRENNDISPETRKSAYGHPC